MTRRVQLRKLSRHGTFTARASLKENLGRFRAVEVTVMDRNGMSWTASAPRNAMRGPDRICMSDPTSMLDEQLISTSGLGPYTAKYDNPDRATSRTTVKNVVIADRIAMRGQGAQWNCVVPDGNGIHCPGPHWHTRSRT